MFGRLNPIRRLGRRAVPWLILLDLLRQTRAHWTNHLTPEERSRLTELLRRSKARKGNLSAAEQAEVRKLADKLDVVKLAGSLGMTAVGLRGVKKRRGR